VKKIKPDNLWEIGGEVKTLNGENLTAEEGAKRKSVVVARQTPRQKASEGNETGEELCKMTRKGR